MGKVVLRWAHPNKVLKNEAISETSFFCLVRSKAATHGFNQSNRLPIKKE
jgi:hypothetical protein